MHGAKGLPKCKRCRKLKQRVLYLLWDPRLISAYMMTLPNIAFSAKEHTSPVALKRLRARCLGLENVKNVAMQK